MTARTLAGPLALTGDFTPGEDGWSPAMNANLLKLSNLAHLIVKSRVTNPPGGTDGDIYIVPHSDGTHPDQVAVKDNGVWNYYPAVVGWRAWVTDENQVYVWNGTAWVTPPQPMDIATYHAAVPTSSEVVFRYVFNRAVSFADDFAGSQASAGATATGATVFSVRKNGVAIGTISFSGGGTTGTFATTGAGVSFAAGDVIDVVGPSTADATIAKLSINFAGTR